VSSTAPDSPPEAPASTTRDEVRVRRTPKYPVFIFGGMILGVIVTFIAVSVAPGRNDDNTPFLQAFGYFVLYGLAIGACVGSLVAILIDAVLSRGAKNIEAERVSTEGVPEADVYEEDAVEEEIVEPEPDRTTQPSPRPDPDELQQ
jgi:hypothetical protein